MKTYSRLLSVIIIICIFLCAVSCQNNEAPGVTTASADSTNKISTSAASTETEPPVNEPVSFNLTKNFKIIRPAEPDILEMNAARLLTRGIKSSCGFSCSTVSDFTPGGEVKPNEFEILIGETNRSESREVFNNLAYNDYQYSIISENVIVICGGSPEMTYTAVERFLYDILGYSENRETEEVISKGSSATLTTGTICSEIAKYPVSSLKILQVPIYSL